MRSMVVLNPAARADLRRADSLNGDKVTDEFYALQDSDFENGEAMIKKGKKVFYKIVRK